ncbi:helix-turn-helix domain-containing protein [Methylobacterium planeticum]|uniref:Helix-turn-helix domain-containing protein n=1 Tax=Methylobacterium planeticum TaxID=2615211 RepID=A0A6N6MDQ8_9HYPH|nr:helix-turn-helix domain-containing protein [Methylobacterium planeticum]KAB1068868.1 helix-turn-helix domain-containing protein [Methylobacterium planeticum]
MDVERRLEVVEQENLFLRERVAALESILTECYRPPVEWCLTGQEVRVFGCLVNREVATKDAIMTALYADRATVEEVAEPKIVDVFICKIRKKLRPYGVGIQTVWGQGYALDADTRAAHRRDTTRAVA